MHINTSLISMVMGSLACAGCACAGGSTPSNNAPGLGGSAGSGSGGSGGSGGSSSGAGHVVGAEGVPAFAQLGAADQTALKQTKVFFFHMSVGGNLVSGNNHYDPPWVAGTNSLGYVFDDVESASDYGSGKALGEHIFGQNGDPIAKIQMFQDWVGNKSIGSAVKVAGMKFCYSDLVYGSGGGQDLSAVQQSYSSMMSSLKGSYPAVSFFHVTPPLQPANEWQSVENNNHRKAFGDWLKSTYSGDVVFDLEAVESTASDGSSCTQGGALVLCDEWKADNDGHLNDAGSTYAAKAFLYALHLAGAK
jgi:hypothetical protein